MSFEASTGVSPWFPPPGLTLAVLFAFGLTYAPVALLGPLVSGLLVNPRPVPPLAQLTLSLIITGGYSMAALVLRRMLGVDPALRRLRDVVKEQLGM